MRMRITTAPPHRSIPSPPPKRQRSVTYAPPRIFRWIKKADGCIRRVNGESEDSVKIRCFIGYDPNEEVAWSVAAHSVIRRSSVPVLVCGLRLGQLPLKRGRWEGQSTEFAFSRFLVPWLSGYEGYSVFMDCDVLMRGDIAELVGGVDPSCAVSVVKHEYEPRPEDKFLGQKQTIYEKKNWSSVMVFNNARCGVLTPGYVDRASGLELHQFKWLESDELVGELGVEWNHLVGEYAPNPKAKLVHFTRGTPCFRGFAGCEFSQEWRDELWHLNSYNQRGEFDRRPRDVGPVWGEGR